MLKSQFSRKVGNYNLQQFYTQHFINWNWFLQTHDIRSAQELIYRGHVVCERKGYLMEEQNDDAGKNGDYFEILHALVIFWMSTEIASKVQIVFVAKWKGPSYMSLCKQKQKVGVEDCKDGYIKFITPPMFLICFRITLIPYQEMSSLILFQNTGFKSSIH